ncbi:MAG TPA: insulinase family protein [Vicinamibacterales bacterium]|nr:insulinase family protein [Vicinamibacterales bacterium]
MKKQLLLLALVAATTIGVAAQTLNLQDQIPFDSAVKTGTLPNGLKYFVRQNSRPAKRVSLRLAVKAGSLNEADDQQGLAHLIEHMAFNGSTHFKAGEMFAYFERVGARLGPHVNAYTSFDETVYMLDLPSDNPEVISKGLTALSDDAGGLLLDKVEVDKERPVVIEEWRLGLGASSRIRDKQFPILFYQSRYAQRLPIGKPDIIRNAPVERLRAFYDTWYRPDHMAVIVVGDIDPAKLETEVRETFSPLTARAPAAPEPDRTVPVTHPPLVNVTTDQELTRSSVQVLRKHTRDNNTRVEDYRRDLVQRLVDHMIGERFDEMARKPDAKFLGAGAGDEGLSRTAEAYVMGASVQDGKINDGLSALAVEAKRLQQFGFSDSEVDRAKRWTLAFYERAYNERDKNESPSFAQEYLSYFLTGEPSPGIDYEYRLVKQVLPTITTAETSQMIKSLLAGGGEVILATAPQKADVKVPTDTELQATLRSADSATVTAWADTAATHGLMEKPPTPGTVTSRRTLDDIGVTIVKLSNGVEAWLKPTDFKNDQVLFSLQGPGGSSLAPPAEYVDAELASSYASLSGAGGLKATDLQKVLTGKLVAANAFIGLSNRGINGNAIPAELETALQLMYERFTAPGDDPDAFAVMKRQLDAMVANRGRSPQQIYGEKLAQINTSNHYTAQPLTPEVVATVDRAKMAAFYKQQFANAADFTFFMVGAFKVDEAIPLVAKYVGSLPSTGQRTTNFKDVGIHFPEQSQKEKVIAGQEPRGTATMSFYADPPIDPLEQEKIIEATTVLEIALRDILREDMGQTYGVSVGLSQQLPQKGTGFISVRFGAAPENIEGMTARVIEEIKKMQDNGPSEDLTNRAKETARRGYETALKTNDYWLGRLSTVKMYDRNPSEILTREQRINSITPQVLQQVFKQYFPLNRTTTVTLLPSSATKEP